MSTIGTNIEQAIHHLQSGDTVAIPTETVYGLAANALDEQAVTKIFRIKNRPTFDPLIVHTSSISRIKGYVSSIPQKAEQLAQAFWPGPLTLLLEKNPIIPDLVTSGLPQVGIRIPNHSLTLELLNRLDFPLAAPSANPFGYISPTEPAHVEKQLGTLVPYILDGGNCEVGVESTIVGFENETPCVYRLGGVKIEDIEKVVGKVSLKLNNSSNPSAPGMLKSHYAPTAPMVIGDIKSLLHKHSGKHVGILSFRDTYEIPGECQIALSPQGNLDEAAKNLFKALRDLDSRGFDLIITEKFPDTGLGKPINDRLKRASVK